ncbi:hypothetical protein ACFL1H_01805 [Nanoarchaeota archaeon]
MKARLESILEIEHYKGDFYRTGTEKGPDNFLIPADHYAKIEVSSDRDITEVKIQPQHLYPDWERMNDKRIKIFDDKIKEIIQQKPTIEFEIDKDGMYAPIYEQIKQYL